jgi:hypothetical protein
VIDLKKCPGSDLPAREIPECSVCGARFWIGMNGNECGTIPPHAQRHEPSARYYPRVADMYDHPILYAAATHRLTEEQAIDMLAAENRDLRARLMRVLELHGVPMAIVGEAPKRLTVPDVIERFRAYHDAHLAWGSLTSCSMMATSVTPASSIALRARSCLATLKARRLRASC